jgi:hypothetical protein
MQGMSVRIMGAENTVGAAATRGFDYIALLINELLGRNLSCSCTFDFNHMKLAYEDVLPTRYSTKEIRLTFFKREKIEEETQPYQRRQPARSMAVSSGRSSASTPAPTPAHLLDTEDSTTQN